MNKISDIRDDVQDFAEEVIEKNHLENLADFIFLGLEQQKTMVKAARANPTNEWLAKTDNVIILYFDQKLYDLLDVEAREILILNALSGLSYDSEKARTKLEQPELQISVGCYEKYKDKLMRAAELAYQGRQQLE